MKTFWTSTALLACLVFIGGCAGTQERPRSTGALIDDNILEVAIEREIRASEEAYKGAHLVVAVYDGVVLLLGFFKIVVAVKHKQSIIVHSSLAAQ